MWLQSLVLLVVLILTRSLWRRWKYDLHRIPSPPGLPLLGHTLEFSSGLASRQLAVWLGRSLKQLGFPKLMRVDVMGSPWLIVTDLNFIKDTMMSKTAPFPRSVKYGTVLIMVGNDSTAKSLSTSPLSTPYVKAVRKVATTAFQTSNLKILMPKINKVIDEMISIVESKREKGPVDFQSLFVRMALDVVGVAAFDSNLGGLDGSRDLHTLLLQAGYVLRDQYKNPLKKAYFELFPNCKGAQTQNAIISKLTEEWEKLTNEILERDDPPAGEAPVWFTLRNLTDPETGKAILHSSLLSEVAGLVLGGMDTTGHTLGWLFALLASHPHVVDKLLETLRENGLYGPGARDVTFEDLGELSYLTAVIKEGMRIAYIISICLLRVVPRDMTILGYRIPKDTFIVCPGTRSLISEEMWGDPHIFRPERWLTGEDMSQKYSFGFSFGPRDCVGQKLAMLEMRLVIIKLLTQFQFFPTETLDETFNNAVDGLLIEAKNGIQLNVEPRLLAT